MTSENVSAAVHATLEDWVAEGYTPRAINNGDCLMFATEVVNECSGAFMKRTGDEDVLGTPENPQYDMEPFHVWVCDGNRHYDAEAPNGVDNWWELPFFQRFGYDENTAAVGDGAADRHGG